MFLSKKKYTCSGIIELITNLDIATGFFQSSRGIGQGDPLSPFLFIIAMEVFSCLMNKAVREGYLPGRRVRGGEDQGPLFNHLLFADDTLVFCEAS